MLDWLIEPLQYSFMLRGMLAAIIVGAVSAVVGSYVVLRGMAFFGDALAHSILPGLAAGYLVSGSGRETLFWWALGSAVVTSLGIGVLTRGSKIREDTAIGILFAGMFALGVAMISTTRNYSVDLAHFLFGNVLGVSDADLLRIGVVAAIILLIIFALYKEFLLVSFDPVLARTLRVPASLLDNLLFILIALTVVVSLQTVGVALMMAMLVTPAAAAYLITRRLVTMMVIAAGFAMLSGVIGLYLSYYLGVASGSAVVLTSTAIFLIVWTGQRISQRLQHNA